MKRLFIMLLIACSAITTISAESLDNDQKKSKVDTTPINVKALFFQIIKDFGDTSDQFYSVYKNPETNQIETSIKITNFSSSLTMQGLRLHIPSIAESFMKDEPKSYQMLHLAPSSTEMFTLAVVNENGQNSAQYRIRTKRDQEMWLMCCKNPQNPKLRDVYAITWVISEKKSKVTGTVFQITSLRPDMYEKPMISDNSIFSIDGRVGDDLNDSLYVVYVADNAEELNNIADDAFVYTMPVVNKRFTFNISLDKPKVGRIRTVMPDGSLCKLWTNLDFVPGETYRITTHNGWYEEDRDYEYRVGRYSGKSLLNDLQKRGVDDQTAVVVDTIPVEYRNPDMRADWRETVAPQYKKQLQLKFELVEMNLESIKANYQLIDDEMKGMRDHYKISTIYEKILKQNKEMDKKLQEVLKLAKEAGCPAKEMPTLYKEILEIYTEQNQAVNNFYKNFGYGTNAKPARKLQEFLTKQTEKYLKDLEKSLIE
ncbi:MAG: hypothetical protein K6F43_01615 [Prevotella sp.]|nr:hypothetical protein [Prevotella sp.]